MFPIQKLLLLPELNDIELNDINSDQIKENSRVCSSNKIPTNNLVNNDLINNNECGLLCNEVVSARIIVNGLTASWTHVNTCSNI